MCGTYESDARIGMMQVIALQQQAQPIEPVSTGPHAEREAKYKVVISNLLSLNCKSEEAVSAFLDGLTIEE